MKKISLLLCIGLCCLSLTGCIDIVQHITRKSDGTEQNPISSTVTTAVLELFASMQGNTSLNYD